VSSTWPEFWERQERVAQHELEKIGWRFLATAGTVGVTDQERHTFEVPSLRAAISVIERIALEHMRKDARRCSACGKAICPDCRDEDIEMHRSCAAPKGAT
jgi:hypothetical protein